MPRVERAAGEIVLHADIVAGRQVVIGPDVIDTAESALTLGVAVTISQTRPTGTAITTEIGVS